jgi:hypothetical protein
MPLSEGGRELYRRVDRPTSRCGATMMDVNSPNVEQRRRFEQLCLLRSLYARRGVEDASSVMTLAEVADHARALLDEAPGDVESNPAARDI